MSERKNWFARHPVWSTIIVLFVIGLLWSAFRSPTNEINNASNTEQGTTLSSANWHEVTTFSGTENKNTDSFKIQGSKFRLTYTVEPDNEYSLFTFYVYPDGDSQVFKDTASLSSGTDSTVVYSGSGSYYLKIVSANLKGWNIKVEDYY